MVSCETILRNETSELKKQQSKARVESKEEPAMKDDSLLAVPHLLHPDMPYVSATANFSYENSFSDASTSDHSQETSDVNLSLQCRVDTYSSKNRFNLSLIFLENTEGEHICFLSTPQPNSSNHEDANKHPEFSDLGCHDLFTSSFNHDVDSTIVKLSKRLVYDDLSIQEVETPSTVKALQPKLMVMLGPCYPEVGLTSGHEIVETLKAPHHSLLFTKDQPNTHILLPPLELHDPITHALEESYTASTHSQHKWSTFLTFACMSQSRECIHSTSACSVAQHHGSTTECMSCTITHLCFVVTCKLGVCLSSLLHLSFFLGRTTV